MLLTYLVARSVESTDKKIDQLTKLVIKDTDERNEAKFGKIAYECRSGGWPQWTENAPQNRAFVPHINPEPYLSMDIFASRLLEAEAKASADARETVRFLERVERVFGAYLPQAICEVAVSHPEPIIRAWAASRINLIEKDYSHVDHSSAESYRKTLNNAPISRDYCAQLRADTDPLGRAALLANPTNKEQSSGWANVTWWPSFIALSQLERLALARRPSLKAEFLLAVMRSLEHDAGLHESDCVEFIAAAVLNPDLIETSRREGRDWYLGFDEPFPAIEEFAEVWKLAATTWKTRNPVAYRVFAFMQTKAAVKIEIYRQLGTEGETFLQAAIVKGCDPSEDRELLKTALGSDDYSIRNTALERCGDYLSYVEKFKPKKK